ncbi:unnamed protein product [Pleuronectes platessa]|uniref:Uncharacterized protein n=1 Tax=Pleuronectes platessa TaxID=8262 RepID=A0A9N7ULU1_PLEPL|nr:unnamed protein product [Pleuronectes platessa]
MKLIHREKLACSLLLVVPWDEDVFAPSRCHGPDPALEPPPPPHPGSRSTPAGVWCWSTGGELSQNQEQTSGLSLGRRDGSQSSSPGRAVHAETTASTKALFVPSFVVANKSQKPPRCGTQQDTSASAWTNEGELRALPPAAVAAIFQDDARSLRPCVCRKPPGEATTSGRAGASLSRSCTLNRSEGA